MTDAVDEHTIRSQRDVIARFQERALTDDQALHHARMAIWRLADGLGFSREIVLSGELRPDKKMWAGTLHTIRRGLGLE